MNKAKIYLRTKGNIQEMIQTYEKVFKAKILKKSFLNIGDIELKNTTEKSIISYASISILNDITIMIAKYNKDFPAYGYSQDIILSLDSKDNFIEIYENLKESPDFKMDYEPSKMDWGTTITKAYDRWGNGWILEIRA